MPNKYEAIRKAMNAELAYFVGRSQFAIDAEGQKYHFNEDDMTEYLLTHMKVHAANLAQKLEYLHQELVAIAEGGSY